MTTSKRTAVIRLMACCLGLAAFISTADIARATVDYCESNRDCDRTEYCGADNKCHDRPSCDDRDACTLDKYEGRGRCSHTRIDGCKSSRMRLKSTLATAGLATISPSRQEVFLQIRPAGSRDILCARVPASKFTARPRTLRLRSRMFSAPAA